MWWSLVTLALGAATVVVVSGVVRQLRMARALERIARTQRGELGEPIDDLDKAEGQDAVALSGILVVERGSLPSYADGRPAAVAGVDPLRSPLWVSRPEFETRSAESLRLKLDDGDVPIDGEIVLLGGSSETWCGHEIPRKTFARLDAQLEDIDNWRFVRVASLHDGDRVLLSCAVVRDEKAAGEGTYRSRDMKYRAVPAKNAGSATVPIIAADKPRVRAPWIRPMTRGRIALALIAGFSSCFPVFSYEMQRNDCSNGLPCQGDGRCDVEHDEGLTWRCVATNPAECAQSTKCGSDGACSLKGDICAPGNSEECSRSRECREVGTCDYGGEACIAIEDEGCAASELCRVEGRCIARDGKCEAATDADCRKTKRCTEWGKCDAAGGKCKATDAGCALSEGCKLLGMCAAGEDNCVSKSDSQCGGSEACRRYGHCAVDDDGACRATTEAHCKESAICRAQRKCRFDGSRCVR